MTRFNAPGSGSRPTAGTTDRGAAVELVPDALDDWFPAELQRYYVNQLNPRVGMTRTRARYFVKLWGYLMLKDRLETERSLQPITRLVRPDEYVVCTHREAFELFYAGQERGSERSAGMMLDHFAKLGLIRKVFDGNTIRIQIQALPQMVESPEPEEPVAYQLDDFNPGRDAILVGTFLAENYNWMNQSTDAVPHRIGRLLRGWAQRYPQGMRVLRRSDTQRPVGFYMLYPVDPSTESLFFSTPRKGLHLSTSQAEDPFQLATPGDPNCQAIFVRSWMVNRAEMSAATVQQLLLDTQVTLQKVRQDFPTASDLYGLTIHPMYEELGRVLGFEQIGTDPQLSIHWVYLAIEQFLETDIAAAVARLNLGK